MTPSRRRLTLALLALAATAGAVPPTRAEGTAPTAAAVIRNKEKAIFSVSDNDAQKWNLTLGNINNALDGIGQDGAEIELVVYGPAIAMLKKDSPVADKLAAALARGVRIAACQNSMRGFHLEAADLAPGMTPVPSGVVELIRREHDGYAYVRS